MADPDCIPGALMQAVVRAGAAREIARSARHLRPWLEDDGWLRGIAARAVAGLAADPLHLPPMRASRSGRLRHLVLARTERVTMALTMIAPGVAPGNVEAEVEDAAKHVYLSGNFVMTRVLGSTGCVVDQFGLAEDGHIVPMGARTLAPGAVAETDERVVAWRLRDTAERIMLLQARIAPHAPAPVRCHDGATGALVARSASDERAARSLMMLGLLRAMDRRDAAPCFAQAARHRDPFQRWAAMREYVALDAGAALAELDAMATGDADPRLRDLARQTITTIETARPCPA